MTYDDRSPPARRWPVVYNGGPLSGHAWLVLHNGSLMLQPRARGLHSLVTLSDQPPATELVHQRRRVDVIHARLLPPNMNGSLLIHAATRAYVASALPWRVLRRQIIPSLEQSGFIVVPHATSLSLGTDLAASSARGQGRLS